VTRFVRCNGSNSLRINSAEPSRRAMTLIEVVAGIALLGTILTTTVMAQARLLRQHQRALIKLQAVEAVDRLLTQWSVAGEEIPVESSGVLLDTQKVTWRTRLRSAKTSGPLSVAIVELVASASGDPPGIPPLVRVEVAVPPRGSP
jgi:type II secretory pathway pseudopilin PulG